MAYSEHSIDIIYTNDEDSYLNMPCILKMRSRFWGETNFWLVTGKPVPTGTEGKKTHKPKNQGDRIMFLILVFRREYILIIWHIRDLLGMPEEGTFRKS